RTRTIRSTLHEVEITLVITTIMVILVMGLFLRQLSATLIVGAVLGVALISTCAAMYMLGFSLNNLTLVALVIAVGFVVDDAIVVTENITRHLEEGKSPMDAALTGARQIGFTILSITASLIAVFIPILMMGGVVGRLFREFAVTLSLAIAISAVISLTLTPMLCSRWLRPAHREQNRVQRWLERAFDSLQAGYVRMLEWVLSHQRVMQLLTLGTLAASVALFVAVPKGLFPQQDTGLLMGFVQAPQDVSFRTMRERAEQIGKVVQADPDVDQVVQFIGGGNATTNTGTVFVGLKPKPARKSTPDEIIARLRPKLGKVSGINLYMQAAQDLRVGGRASRTQYQYTLQDVDLAELTTWSPRLLETLKQLPELRDVATDQQNAGLELRLNLDRDTAARVGVSPQLFDNVLYDAFGQRQVATTFTALNQYRVVMEVQPEFAKSPADVDRLYVGTPTGQVPLRALAHSEIRNAALAVNHQGQFPSVTLSFNLAPGVALGQAVDAIHAAERRMGLPPTVRASFQGTAQAFRDSLASQPILIGAALLTVYIVLGVLYESFAHPFTILSTLPSAGLGALLALLLTNSELNVIALIGIVLLIGIVKKNAILMIDFALEAEREHHLSSLDAVREACRLRFRPILMTTLAALLGAVPLAFGSGAGAELRRPLGLTIIGGLLVSQLLTLFTTPIVYLTLARISERRRARKARREELVSAVN
ncbi:MAG TPA: efflux RND transporter permease subunit, partial [Polyangiaceae bacterium]|nr:efflux RND transporter permease subunit [Polyangiaceae bacterium]